MSLALCALSGNFVILSFARLLAGFGAAAAFVAGAALAALIAQAQPARANFLLSLFYAGPGLGILSSGLIAPFVLQAFGPGSWWIVWWAMTLLAIALTIPLLLAPLDTGPASPARRLPNSRIRPVLIYLAGYFLFGAGYIAYMTFMIAYVRDAGGGARGAERVLVPDRRERVRDPVAMAPGAGAQQRRPLHRDHPRRQRDRRGTAAVRAFRAAARGIGAGVRGRPSSRSSGSTTAFVRFNYPPAAWPKGIAAMTIAFGIGQTLGPTAVGAITDAFGSLSYALNVSAAMLALGAIAAAFQGRLAQTSIVGLARFVPPATA